MTFRIHPEFPNWEIRAGLNEVRGEDRTTFQARFTGGGDAPVFRDRYGDKPVCIINGIGYIGVELFLLVNPEGNHQTEHLGGSRVVKKGDEWERGELSSGDAFTEAARQSIRREVTGLLEECRDDGTLALLVADAYRRKAEHARNHAERLTQDAADTLKQAEEYDRLAEQSEGFAGDAHEVYLEQEAARRGG